MPIISYADLEEIGPHKDELVVISIIMMGRNAHWVLVDQGNSTDFMLWTKFVGRQVSKSQLNLFEGRTCWSTRLCQFEDDLHKWSWGEYHSRKVNYGKTPSS